MTFDRSVLAAAVLFAAVAPALSAQPAAPAAPLQLLDVPYLPQSEDLCGAAAAAMVMRYWGATGVYAESFGALVDRTAGGIRADDLLQAARARGWDAQSFRGDAAAVRAHLDKRRPVIALLEDRPGRFHYVVVVGWRAGRVFLHDPARAPFRILDEDAFNRAWAVSAFWTLVVVPSSPAATAMPRGGGETSPPATAPGEPGPCGGMVEEAVRLAGAGERPAARTLLEAAIAACPTSAAPWRELAGLHALERAWGEAAAHARQAVSRDRHDRHAWRLLATSLYLEGDELGALPAWNHLDEPIVDRVNVNGLERLRYGVVARTLGLAPRTLLTPDALRTAERRVSELPAAQFARVTYRPAENGLANLEATVIERPLLPVTPVALAAAGVRLATDRELSIFLANPSGGGELWTAAWRWWARRPRVALAVAAPAPRGGVWRVEVSDDRQTYGDGTRTIVERRRSGSIAMSNWLSGTTRIELRAGADRWRDRGRATLLDGRVEQRLASGAIDVSARIGTWLGTVGTWTAATIVDWRSSTIREGDVWSARGAVEAVGKSAPLALWAGAGTGQGRDTLLRAHPLLDDGVIEEGVFGRRLIHGGVEWRRWIRPRRLPLRVAPAAFIDVARAFDGLPTSDRRAHVDVGAGVRIALPGASAVRVDAARGLRDARMAVSVGWTK